MTSKRQLSQSSNPTPARSTKRTRLSSPSAPPSSSYNPEPSTLLDAAPSQPVASTSTLPPLPEPKKRTRTEGTLRRLSSGHPSSSRVASGTRGLGGVRPKQTLSGEKVGGKSKDLRDGADEEEMWVRRSGGGGKQGLGFAGYLKKGVSAFVERGCTTLTVNAMGAAIPLALSLALAIRDAIPGGEPSSLPGEDDSADEAEQEGDEIVQMEVRTGSKVVKDEVTPDDEDEDIVYQSRTKSTVQVTLRLTQPLASALGQAKKPARERGGASVRGRKRRGGKR
ncbi:hypothetical protein JCM8097_008298 [Rhodosporidiobolus ruineniae]